MGKIDLTDTHLYEQGFRLSGPVTDIYWVTLALNSKLLGFYLDDELEANSCGNHVHDLRFVFDDSQSGKIQLETTCVLTDEECSVIDSFLRKGMGLEEGDMKSNYRNGFLCNWIKDEMTDKTVQPFVETGCGGFRMADEAPVLTDKDLDFSKQIDLSAFGLY